MSTLPDGLPDQMPGRPAPSSRLPLGGYNLALGMLSPLLVSFGAWRLARAGHDAALQERFGLGAFLPPHGQRLWIHGASVGEVLALAPVMDRLRATGQEILLSTVTTTGRKAALRTLPGVRHRYLPVDLAPAVGGSLARVRPSVLALTESELWPNLVVQASRIVPVVILNGRVSDATLQRGTGPGLRAFYRWLLGHLTFVGARSPEDARRFVALGLPGDRVAVLGNVKFDRTFPIPDPETRRRLQTDLGVGGGPLIVGGSTFPGEETVLLGAFRALQGKHPDLRLLLAPRHPERGKDVMGEVQAAGFTGVFRTEGALSADRPVMVLDTLGELAELYAVATAAFVGRSLVGVGGQNPIEPMAQGIPVLFGPSMENFRDVAGEALAGGAAEEVRSSADLTSLLDALLSDPTRRERMGKAGQGLVNRHRGAASRYVELLLEVSRPSA